MYLDYQIGPVKNLLVVHKCATKLFFFFSCRKDLLFINFKVFSM